MTIQAIPVDPFALVVPEPLDLAGRAQREVFGAPATLLSLPHRTARHGVPGADRPPFQANRADAIIAVESAWRAPGMAMTGNRYPFSAQQVILWATERRREPTLAMLEVAYRMEDAVGGTTLINSIGAAGSVTRSHIHLIGEVAPFLAGLARSELDPARVHLTAGQWTGCTVLRLDPPFPIIAVGVRGPAADRARAMHHLLECRTSQAFNMVGNDRTAWLVPRSGVEITAPHFPQALGGAEISGLWCADDPAVFANLTAADMEAAIRLGGIPWPDQDE